MAQGLGTADIAHSLSISPTTVRNHVQSILHKFQVHSRLEAVTYAFEHDLTGKN
jgi:DNA-binding NarL/FixJ family response regulator